MRFSILLAFVFSMCLVSCSSAQKKEEGTTKDNPYELPTEFEGKATAYFASGCFWCVEAVYESVKGVSEVISGYAGGNTINPTYYEVGSGKTGHAECNLVIYDPEIISYKDLVTVFFGSGDPTTPNQQGPDKGSAYRSMIFYQSDSEKEIIDNAMAQLEQNKVFRNPIITEVVPFEKFYIAEDYHQNYERLNPGNRYVQGVSIPRLNRFKAKFPELLGETMEH